ncbi:DEAD/DEAH box helicase [Hyphomicrobium sp. DY-1]
MADDMGVGKTAQAIAACDLINAKNITVVVPAIMRQAWAREFRRFSNQPRVCTIIGSAEQPMPDKGVVIVAFEAATAPTIRNALRKRDCDVLIVDEAHYLKERGSARTIAIYGPQCDGKLGVAEFARRIWPLSGSLAPNHPGETYPHLRIAGTWRQGYWDFMRAFTRGKSGPYGYIVTGNKDAPRLRELIKQVFLRREREEVLKDLPSLVVDQLPIEPCEVHPDKPILDRLQELKPQFEAVVKEAMDTGDWSLTKVKHIAVVRRLIGMAKVRNVAEYVRGVMTDDPSAKMILFAIHRDVINFLQQYLIGYHPRIIYGGTPDEKKQNIIDQFQTNHNRRLIICQIKTAGLGITLTAAHRVLIVEPSWSPADNWQAICRAHRMGQKRPVLAQLVSLSGSIDEAVNRVLLRKTEAISALFE